MSECDWVEEVFVGVREKIKFSVATIFPLISFNFKDNFCDRWDFDFIFLVKLKGFIAFEKVNGRLSLKTVGVYL